MITGVNCAWEPAINLNCGCLLKLIISEEPYPTPLSVKWTDLIDPLKIGCVSHSKVSPAIEDIPTLPLRLIVIGW